MGQCYRILERYGPAEREDGLSRRAERGTELAVSQLGLFGTEAAIVTDEEARAAESLPAFVRFGTSSWTFPGWSMWPSAPSLRTYATHPLMRTAGVDRSFYGPLVDRDAAEYAEQLRANPDFRFVAKAWEEITTYSFPAHRRYGARAGTKNASFLDFSRFERTLAPYRRLPRTAFVFELTSAPPGAVTEREWIHRVETFAMQLPAGSWGFELRNKEFLGRRWFDMLRAVGAAHVFTYWTAMPSLREQLALGGLHGGHVIARLMLPPFARYEEKKRQFAPFDKLAERQPAMRDDVIELLREAAQAGVKDAFVIVNNKAEGSAPLTIRELATRAARELR